MSNMQISSFCRLLLICACLGSVSARAGVGATSAGVVGSVPQTNPSSDVQAQSAGFVQQNQQSQNPVTQNGSTAMSSSASGNPNSAQGGANGTAGNTDPKQKSGDPAQAPAQPAAPPPPPPDYVSVVRHIKPQTPDGTTSTTVVAAPAPATAAADQNKAGAPSAEPATPIRAAPAAPAMNSPAAIADANAKAEAAQAARRSAAVPAVTGGSGAAPDGFAFYLGLGIAAALLAFALSAYLRSRKDETTRYPPGG